MSFFDSVGVCGAGLVGIVAIIGTIRLLSMLFMTFEATRYRYVPENRRQYFLQVQEWHIQRALITYLIIAVIVALIFSQRPLISLESTIRGGNVSGRLAEIMLAFQNWARDGGLGRWLLVGLYWPITGVLFLVPELVFGVLGTLISVGCTLGVLGALLGALFAPAATVAHNVIVVLIFRREH